MAKNFDDFLKARYTPEQIAAIKAESQRMVDEIPPFDTEKAVDALFRHMEGKLELNEAVELLRGAVFEIDRTRNKNNV